MNDDDFVVLLLCSHIERGSQPLSTIEWSCLWSELCERGLTPSALFDVQEMDFLDVPFRKRIEKLLGASHIAHMKIQELLNSGMGIVTVNDEEYPERLKKNMKSLAPPVLFYCGDIAMASRESIAIVGSRNADYGDKRFAEALTEKCVRSGFAIISGGARGIDSVAEKSALDCCGQVVVYPSCRMERKVRERHREIKAGKMLVLSSILPDAEFQSSYALERNKYIHASANAAVAVSSEQAKGGTWSGSLHNIKNGWSPLMVAWHNDRKVGNRALLTYEGTRLITYNTLKKPVNEFCQWMLNC